MTTRKHEQPPVWWSPTHGLITVERDVWWRIADTKVSLRHDGLPNELPSDAIPLAAPSPAAADQIEAILDEHLWVEDDRTIEAVIQGKRDAAEALAAGLLRGRDTAQEDDSTSELRNERDAAWHELEQVAVLCGGGPGHPHVVDLVRRALANRSNLDGEAPIGRAADNQATELARAALGAARGSAS